MPDHVDSQDSAPPNVFVESDGPESDKPETTASMGEGCTVFQHALEQRLQLVCNPVAGSMLEQSMEGWRLIGQAMRSLLSCTCLDYPSRPRAALKQLRATAKPQ